MAQEIFVKKRNAAEDMVSVFTKENQMLVETDPIKSAPVLKDLGIIYKDLCDANNHRNFIFCVGLLAAAHIRNPQDQTVGQVMHELWRKLLQSSDSVDQQGDFVMIAKHLQQRINKLREDAKNEMDQIPPVIDDLENKQSQEATKTIFVKNLMDKISDQCIDALKFVSEQCLWIVFGPEVSTVKFAHVALGSIARSEATPCSDIESMILLEDDLDKDEEERLV